MAEYKSLPNPNDKSFGARVREFALVGMGMLGDKTSAFVRLKDLQDAGLAVISPAYLAGAGATGGTKPIAGPGPVLQPAYEVDLTPPPAPSGFTASTSKVNIQFQVDPPIYRQGNGHAKTVVYGAPYSGTGPLPVFSDAVAITEFVGVVFAAPIDPGATYRLWATWVSRDVVESQPAGGTNGIEATTDLLDDVNIANLSASKITAGVIRVGEYIQSADYVAGVSGWRISTLSGGEAFFEVRGNAVFGGTIYAGAGLIGGSEIGADYIRSTSYVPGVSGWRLNSNGEGQIGGFIVTPSDIRSTNYVANTSGWVINRSGFAQFSDILLTGGTLRNSSGSFSISMNATGSDLLMRAGVATYYGPYAGTHYPVEIYANGSAFFGRGSVSGGSVRASGTLTVSLVERPCIYFQTVPVVLPGGDGGGGDGGE